MTREQIEEVLLLRCRELGQRDVLPRPDRWRAGNGGPTAVGRRGTGARCGTARRPRRRTAAPPPHLDRCRRSRERRGGAARLRAVAARPGRRPGEAAQRGPRPCTTIPLLPSTEINSPSATVWPSNVIVRFTKSMRSAVAPHTAGRPRPRATTAAWAAKPPRDVTMAFAASMPGRSPGEVSSATSTTDSPLSVSSTARSLLSATRPTAAPTDAGRPRPNSSLPTSEL